MRKLSILVAAGLLSSSLYAAQAQAVTQTLEWCFLPNNTCTQNSTYLAPNPTLSATFDGTDSSNTASAAQKAILASGGYYATGTPASTFTANIQGTSSAGLGVEDTVLTGADIRGNGLYTEFVKLDMTQVQLFTNSLGGHWEIDIYNPDALINERLELKDSDNPLLTSAATNVSPLTQLNQGLNTTSFTLSNNFLYILPKSTTEGGEVTFYLGAVRFVWDDGQCPDTGCDVPEPGMLGLLGLSLAGLAYIRSKKQA